LSGTIRFSTFPRTAVTDITGMVMVMMGKAANLNPTFTAADYIGGNF